MAQNPPFVFGAGTAQGAPAFPRQQQRVPQVAPSSSSAHAPPPPQPAFQQNGQLPGIDMSALAGISPDQVALIARLLQTGALPLPPPPPGATLHSPAPPAPAVPPPARPAPQSRTQQEDVDMDEEDGGVEEEGEVHDSPLPRVADAFPLNVPKGPRNQNSRASPRQNIRVKPPRFQATASPRPADRQPAQRVHGTTDGGLNILEAKEKAAKDFVLAMHHAGYTYAELARTVDDPKPLRHMFQQLGLPVTSDHGQANGTGRCDQPATTQTPTLTAPATAPIVARQPSATKAPAPPKPAAKPDRNAYLAKLQALKAGKPSSSTTQAPVQPSPSSDSHPTTTTHQSTASAVPAVSSVPPNPKATPTPTSKAVKTGLARQRLEAFKAEQAARQQNKTANSAALQAPAQVSSPSTATFLNAANPSSESGPVLSTRLSDMSDMLGQHPAPVATQGIAPDSAPIQATFSPGSATPSRSFSGLPGLFVSSVPQLASPPVLSQPTATTPQPVAPSFSATQQNYLARKHPITANSDAGSAQLKRPFGQSRSASEDEFFIIENSDDEDEDSRMHIDLATSAMSARNEPIRNAPFRQGFQSTSAPSTPGGVTYDDKVKAIEELNRRIAEKEAKNKAHGKTPTAKAGAAAVAFGLPGISPPTPTTSTLPSVQAQNGSTAVASTTPERSESAAASKLKQQKEELRQRIAELEEARRKVSTKAVQTDTDDFKIATTTDNNLPAEDIENVEEDLYGASNTKPSTPMPEPVVVNAASDDGELEDESDFDFYGDDEVVPVADAADKHEHMDPQATAMSEVIQPDNLPVVQSITQASTSAPCGALNDDVDMFEDAATGDPVSTALDSAAQEAFHSAMETNEAEDIEAAENQEERPRTANSTVDMTGTQSDGGDSSHESSGESEQDLDQPMDLIKDTNRPSEDDLHEQVDLVVEDQAMEASVHRAIDTASRGARDKDELGGAADVIENDHMVEGDADQTGLHDIESSDASSTRSADSDDSDDSEEYEPEPAEMESTDPATFTPDRAADDDLAPELQPSQSQSTTPELNGHGNPAALPKSYYTPYESIMKKFKDYRYHPQYLKDVPMGFKSATYNHQIDPQQPLCPTEAQGGVCYNKSCTGQHFDRMSISDNVLLQQMGTKNIPARGEHETKKWNDGLQEIIKALKAENVRDAATIAKRIAQYRREFVGDPSRVIYMK